MFKPRILLLLFLFLISFTWLFSTGLWKRSKAGRTVNNPEVHHDDDLTSKKLKQKAANAKLFVLKNGYNENICCLIDMSLPSGQERFFVYDFKKDSMQNSGLVTHGRCNQQWLDGRKYSNTTGSGCTSLGKYKIGHAYSGRFGLAYKLYGLEKTNDNAYKRYVVLHSHECVPETKVTDEICQSDGCPTVSPGFLQQLKPIIDRSEKPVLLWIFE